MKPFLPPKAASVAFGFLVSGLMSFIVTGIATLNALGLSDQLISKWLSAWGASWAVAFPVILFVAPLARWLIARLTLKPDNS